MRTALSPRPSWTRLLLGTLLLACAGLASAQRPAAPSAPTPVPTPAATALPLASQVRGVVRAGAEATLTARLATRIVALPLQEGESFRRGAVLVQFDCERQQAELRAAQAALQVQRRNLEAQLELDKHGATGRTEVDMARAQSDKARADADALQTQLRDCSISAPFSGRVVERLARAHEGVAVSQPLLRIQDTGALELDLIVPSTWLAWLQPGVPFRFCIDETQATLDARVHRLGASVDPVSRTVKIVARFAGNAERVLPGMSGSASLAPPPQ